MRSVAAVIPQVFRRGSQWKWATHSVTSHAGADRSRASEFREPKPIRSARIAKQSKRVLARFGKKKVGQMDVRKNIGCAPKRSSDSARADAREEEFVAQNAPRAVHARRGRPLRSRGSRSEEKRGVVRTRARIEDGIRVRWRDRDRKR